MEYSKRVLDINVDEEIKSISDFILETAREQKKENVVVGLRRGIDSALSDFVSINVSGKDRV